MLRKTQPPSAVVAFGFVLSLAPVASASDLRTRAALPTISQLPRATQPVLRPLDLELTPRSFEWVVSGGAGLQPCPATGQCTYSPAWVVLTGLSVRPVSWFSWGINGEVSQRQQLVTHGDYTLVQTQRVYSALLLAKVHWLTSGPTDLYSSMGVGFGLLENRGALSVSGNVLRLAGGPAPETDLAFGWRWRFGPLLSAGVELHFRYWVTAAATRCGTLTRAACPFASNSPVTPEAMLWSLQLTGAVGFGQTL